MQVTAVSLDDLFKSCTVKLSFAGSVGHGTGFFIAPGLILTCAHVVRQKVDQLISVQWQQQPLTAIVERLAHDLETYDLALLRLSNLLAHPCVWLDESVLPNDNLFSYGYPDDFPDGAPVTFEAEGLTGGVPFIKFKFGQVRPGFSGSPLLNRRTGRVCGLIKFTRDRALDLGGGAIPTASILSQFPELVELQRQFHQCDRRWADSTCQIISGQRTLLDSAQGGVVHTLLSEQQPRFTPLQPQFQLRRTYAGLIDRQQETSTVQASLCQSESVEIYAEAGWGKTTLLEFLAQDCQSKALFSDGIIYVRVSDRPFIKDLLQRLFEFLHESDRPFKPTDAQLQRYLQHRKALIVLDDVQFNQDDLKELMAALPNCTFLLATLQRCLVAEQVEAVALQGLPLPDALKLVERALRRALTVAERNAAQALCSALNGHPDKILQALSLVTEQQPLAAIAAQVRAALLTRQVWAILRDNHRRILALLAALGGIALLAQQAAAMTGVPNTTAILEDLAQRNLAITDGDRYRLSDSLKNEFQQVDLTTWNNQVLQYFTLWAEQHRGNSELLLQEQGNLFRALEWAVTQSHWREVLSLVRSLESALMISGQWSAWEQVLQWGLQSAQSIGDPSAEAWVWHQLGTRALCLEEKQTAQDALQRALQLRHSLGDEIGASVTQHNLNLLLLPIPEFEQSDLSSADPTTSPFPPNRWIPWFVGILVFLGIATIGWRLWREQPFPGQPPGPSPSITPSPIPPVTPPSSLQASQTARTEVTLSWQDTSDSETGFRLERRQAGEEFKPIQQLGKNATTFTDSTVTPNTTYDYRVGAIATDGKLSFSNEATIQVKPDPVILPPAPTQLSAQAVSQSEIRLSWKNTGDRFFNIKIERSTENSKPFSQIATVPAGTDTYTDKQLVADTTYIYRIRATSGVGDSPYSDTVNARTLSTPIPSIFISKFTISPDRAVGGTPVTGEVQLETMAPKDVWIQIQSNSNSVDVPESIKITAGEKISDRFPITTKLVSAPTEVTITASYKYQANPSSQEGRLMLTAKPPQLVEAKITNVEIKPSQVTGGTPANGSVFLDRAAPTDGQIELSSVPKIVGIPSIVPVTKGQKEFPFPIKTSPVKQLTPVTITARYNGSNKSQTLDILAPAVTPVDLVAQDIQLCDLKQSSQVAGRIVRITGVVRNNSNGIFDPQNNKAVAQLFQVFPSGVQKLVELPIKNRLEPGEEFLIPYLSKQGTTPPAYSTSLPNYRLVIVTEDINPKNNKTSKISQSCR